MPSVKDILRRMRFNRAWGLSDEGSCFGIADPSLLRPEFYTPPPPKKYVCKGCKSDNHKCETEVQLYKFTETGPEKTKKVPCECKICYPEPLKAA